VKAYKIQAEKTGVVQAMICAQSAIALCWLMNIHPIDRWSLVYVLVPTWIVIARECWLLIRGRAA